MFHTVIIILIRGRYTKYDTLLKISEHTVFSNMSEIYKGNLQWDNAHKGGTTLVLETK